MVLILGHVCTRLFVVLILGMFVPGSEADRAQARRGRFGYPLFAALRCHLWMHLCRVKTPVFDACANVRIRAGSILPGVSPRRDGAAAWRSGASGAGSRGAHALRRTRLAPGLCPNLCLLALFVPRLWKIMFDFGGGGWGAAVQVSMPKSAAFRPPLY